MARRVTKWQLLHTYNFMAGYYRCPEDSFPYTPTFYPKNPNEPVLNCMVCNSKVHLGKAAWDDMLEVVQAKYDVELEN